MKPNVWNLNVCPVCFAYMVMFVDAKMPGWRRCPTCGYCHDRNGENELTKMTKNMCLKFCTSESVECTCEKEKK